MKCLVRLIVWFRHSPRAQTMTEYVLIVAAVASAGYVAYKGLEGGINTLIPT